MMKLLDWIPLDKLDSFELSFNKNAYYLFEQNPNMISWNHIFFCHNNLLYLYKNQEIEWEYNVSIFCKDIRFLLKNENKLVHIWINPAAVCIIKRININYINWDQISLNSSIDIIPFFEKNLNKLNYFLLSRTDNSLILIEKYPELAYKFNWREISKNPNAIPILEKYSNKIVWGYLCLNKNGISMLRQNLNKINWKNISKNKNALSLLYLCPNINLLDWSMLSENNGVVPFLETHIEMIDWNILSSNKNAIHLLERYPEKINWNKLHSNVNGLHILEKNRDKITWSNISGNPSIFKYDYSYIKEQFMKSYGEELLNTILHPNNFHKFREWKLL